MATEVTKHFLQNKKFIFYVSACFFLAGVITSLLLPVSYRSSATLFPANISEMKSQGANSSLSSFFSLASSGDNKLNKHFSILNSEDFWCFPANNKKIKFSIYKNIKNLLKLFILYLKHNNVSQYILKLDIFNAR